MLLPKGADTTWAYERKLLPKTLWWCILCTSPSIVMSLLDLFDIGTFPHHKKKFHFTVNSNSDNLLFQSSSHEFSVPFSYIFICIYIRIWTLCCRYVYMSEWNLFPDETDNDCYCHPLVFFFSFCFFLCTYHHERHLLYYYYYYCLTIGCIYDGVIVVYGKLTL